MLNLLLHLLAVLILLSFFLTIYYEKSKISHSNNNYSNNHQHNPYIDRRIYSKASISYPPKANLSSFTINNNNNIINDNNRNTNYYPQYKSLLDIITQWNPDEADPPIEQKFQETLQHFNYSNINERMMAKYYRDNEIPFKLYNIPDIESVILKWSNEDYLKKELNRISPHVEESKSNHFMYWSLRGTSKMKDYIPPTKLVTLNFNEWLQKAHDADIKKIKSTDKHYYFMTGSLKGDAHHSFIARDFNNIFTDLKEPNFFITNLKGNKGIQCRFAMRGIIAEAHYDTGRNMVAMIKGSKRYILTPPSTCKQLGIIADTKHPSYRHSVLDWSDITQAKSHNFNNIPAIDTIVNEGEVLYIPSYWFHYIISLEYSIQCNSRSGSPPNNEGHDDIKKCFNTK